MMNIASNQQVVMLVDTPSIVIHVLHDHVYYVLVSFPVHL